MFPFTFLDFFFDWLLTNIERGCIQSRSPSHPPNIYKRQKDVNLKNVLIEGRHNILLRGSSDSLQRLVSLTLFIVVFHILH